MSYELKPPISEGLVFFFIGVVLSNMNCLTRLRESSTFILLLLILQFSGVIFTQSGGTFHYMLICPIEGHL